MIARFACALLLAIAHSSHAAVQSAGPGGFVVVVRQTAAVPPAAAYAAFAHVEHWWSPAHSFSGKGANLSLSLTPGGCFCERLPGGGVRFLLVDAAIPPRLLVLHGGLGPLLDQAVTGAMRVTFIPAGAGTAIELRYAVAGAVEPSAPVLAPAVDRVLTEQLARFARFAATGKAEAK